ncbi:hypothetical protein [Scytonema sp. PRP1]|uniref:hypothetical protein n=1 Tax=Scytonema sp. PRP1 TaxID=3120513 RepID=UPI002FD19AF0
MFQNVPKSADLDFLAQFEIAVTRMVEKFFEHWTQKSLTLGVRKKTKTYSTANDTSENEAMGLLAAAVGLLARPGGVAGENA